MGQFFKMPQLSVNVVAIMLEASDCNGPMLWVMTPHGVTLVKKSMIPIGDFRMEIGTGILCDVLHDTFANDDLTVTAVHGLTGWIIPITKRKFWHTCPIGDHTADYTVYQTILDLNATVIYHNEDDSARLYSHNQLGLVYVPERFYNNHNLERIPIEVYISSQKNEFLTLSNQYWKVYDVENAVIEKYQEEECELDKIGKLEFDIDFLKYCNGKLVEQLEKDCIKIKDMERNPKRSGPIPESTEAFRTKIASVIQSYGKKT